MPMLRTHNKYELLSGADLKVNTLGNISSDLI